MKGQTDLSTSIHIPEYRIEIEGNEITITFVSSGKSYKTSISETLNPQAQKKLVNAIIDTIFTDGDMETALIISLALMGRLKEMRRLVPKPDPQVQDNAARQATHSRKVR